MIRHLKESLDDWLKEELDNFTDDDYIVFDCPGIIFVLGTVFFLLIAQLLPGTEAGGGWQVRTV